MMISILNWGGISWVRRRLDRGVLATRRTGRY